MRARAGAGSRRIVLRWGARVVGGLWRRGEGAVVWCLLTPSFRVAARKRVLGRFQEVFSRSNRGIAKNGAREPSPNLSPPGSLAHTKLTEWFGRYKLFFVRFSSENSESAGIPILDSDSETYAADEYLSSGYILTNNDWY